MVMPAWGSRVLRRPRAILLVMTAAAFATAIPNGFVWIDHWQVAEGGLIATSWPALWRSLREPLGAIPGWQGTAPYARPLVVAFLSLDHWLGGTRPAVFHASLVALHLGNVLLAYGLLRDLAIEAPTAFVVTGVFALHPLQTAAVSWISGIADPLFTLFALLAFRLYLVAGRSRRGLIRCAAVASFAAAVAAKETALVLPALIIAAELILPAPLGTVAPPRERVRRLARDLLPFLGVILLDLAYRTVVLRSAAWGGGALIPLSTRLHTLPRLLVSYFTLPLRPEALTVCDDYRLSAGWDGDTILSLLVLAVLFAAAFRFRHRHAAAAFGLAWTVLALLPALNLVPILHYRADRFFYFPFLGWSLAVVTLTEHAALVAAHRLRAPDTSRAVALTALASAVFLTLSVFTAFRNRLFADDLTLFTATVHTSPYCREAHTTLGDALLRAGRTDAAVAEYQRALQADPTRASYVVLPKVLINLGMAELARTDYVAAAAAFTQAHQLQPHLLHPLFGLGVAALAQAHPDDAVPWFEQARALAPDDPDVLFNLALAYDRLGRAADAQPLYAHFLDVAPPGRRRALAQTRLRALSAR